MYRQSEKNLLSSNISSTCPRNMVNYSPLPAEIVSLVWGIPANFNWFRFFPRLISAAADWMSAILPHSLWCSLSANLGCRSETCCTRLAGNAGPKKVAKNRHLGTIAQFCRTICSQLRHASTIGKNMLSSNMSSRRPHNMVNFGPLAAEIVSGVWGTPSNFNGFCVLAALLHGI